MLSRPLTRGIVTSQQLQGGWNSTRFSQAFVQSLAKVNLPRRQATWRLKDYEAFMKDQLIRNIAPGRRVVEPHFYAREPLDGMTVVGHDIPRQSRHCLWSDYLFSAPPNRMANCGSLCVWSLAGTRIKSTSRHNIWGKSGGRRVVSFLWVRIAIPRPSNVISDHLLSSTRS